MANNNNNNSSSPSIDFDSMLKDYFNKNNQRMLSEESLSGIFSKRLAEINKFTDKQVKDIEKKYELLNKNLEKQNAASIDRIKKQLLAGQISADEARARIEAKNRETREKAEIEANAKTLEIERAQRQAESKRAAEEQRQALIKKVREETDFNRKVIAERLADTRREIEEREKENQLFIELINNGAKLSDIEKERFKSNRAELKDLLEKETKLSAVKDAGQSAELKKSLELEQSSKRLGEYRSRVAARKNEQNRIELQYAKDLAEAETIEDADEQFRAIFKAEANKKTAEENADKETGVKLGSILSGFFDAGGNVGDIVSSFITEGGSELTSLFSDAIGAAIPGGTILVSILKGISSAVSSGFKALSKGVDEYLSLEDNYMGRINARLDGFLGDGTDATNFDAFVSEFSNIFAGNPYVSQKKLLENLSSLVEKGISYNLEERTILATLSDRMVSTFDILDETLTRMTKLQNQDLSTSYISAESNLTTFLNSTFKDTSYLSTLYDNVASTLLDASSQMTTDESLQFNYAVQKWLGSLYSVGMSETGISTLASGLAALASGDFSSLEGNDALRTLLVSASGGSYADLLVNGLDVSNINSLLNNIITILSNISTDTNNVTKNVKASVFGGLNLSDLKAANNLITEGYVSTIYSNNLDTSTLNDTFAELLGKAVSNTSTSTWVSNMVDNTLLTLGYSLLHNSESKLSSAGEEAYTSMWEGGMGSSSSANWLNTIADNDALAWVLSSTLGGSFETLAHDLITVNNVKGLVSSLMSSIAGMQSGTAFGTTAGAQFLENWIGNSATTTMRGTTTDALTKGIMEGISSSSTVSFANSKADTDLYNDFVTQAKTVSNAALSVTGTAENVVNRDINDVYRALFEEKIAMRVILASVEEQAKKDLTEKNYKTTEDNSSTICGKLDYNTSKISQEIEDLGNVTCPLAVG